MTVIVLTILTSLLADPPSCWAASPAIDPNIYHCASIACNIVASHTNPPAAEPPHWQFIFVWPPGRLGNPVNASIACDPNDPNTAPTITAAWDVEPVRIDAWLQRPYDLDYDGDCDRNDALIVVRAANLSRTDIVWLIEQMGYSPYDLDNSGCVTTADYSAIKPHLGERWPVTYDDLGAPSLPGVGNTIARPAETVP